DRHAPYQTVRRVHGDGAHRRLAEVLRHLEHQVVLLVSEARVGDVERVEDFRELADRKLDVDDGTYDLRDFSQRGRGRTGCGGRGGHRRGLSHEVFDSVRDRVG